MLVSLFVTIVNLLVVKAHKMEGKVVQGDKAKIQHHPYSAFISVVEKADNEYVAYICGSSIINQKIILSAAHCFERLNPKSKVKANIGSTNRRKGYVFKIRIVKVHPDYNDRTITNDIALAGLQTEIQFSDNVNRVALARIRPLKGVAKLAGWGLINETPMKETEVLHETEQKIWAIKDCWKLLKTIPDGTFCGGTISHGGYPSVGDSGSPLVTNGYLQVGIVSFKKTDISRTVIIYTDVAYFYDWIADNAGAVYCP